jgi:hypothetical protein
MSKKTTEKAAQPTEWVPALEYNKNVATVENIATFAPFAKHWETLQKHEKGKLYDTAALLAILEVTQLISGKTVNNEHTRARVRACSSPNGGFRLTALKQCEGLLYQFGLVDYITPENALAAKILALREAAQAEAKALQEKQLECEKTNVDEPNS